MGGSDPSIRQHGRDADDSDPSSRRRRRATDERRGGPGPTTAAVLALMMVASLLPAPFVEATGSVLGDGLCIDVPGAGERAFKTTSLLPVVLGQTQCARPDPPTVDDDDGGGGREADGSAGAQADPFQEDDDGNLVGDPYEHVYGLEDLAYGVPDRPEQYRDVDDDGLPLHIEFRWGTIPLLDGGIAQAQEAGAGSDFEDLWSRDTDGDRLHDGAERSYWNHWNGSESALEAAKVAQARTEGAAIRDPDSLQDPDGDAQSPEGTCGTPLNVSRQLPDISLVGCSHVADDADSDGDGLADGLEVSTRTRSIDPNVTSPGVDAADFNDSTVGVGRWVADSQGSTHEHHWQGGALAAFPDSECRTAAMEASTDGQGSHGPLLCYNRGNHHNNTEPTNGYRLHLLDPGHGDDLPDRQEHAWYVDLETTTDERYNNEAGENQTAWEYHKARRNWTQEDAKGRLLHGYEIDYDGDDVLPLMEDDADGDGLRDPREARGCPGSLPYVPDTDYDGLTDLHECGNPDHAGNGTEAANWDTDGDGLPDGYEARLGLDPTDGAGPHGADGDPDGDGLGNRREYCYRPPTSDGPATDATGGQGPAWWGCGDHPDYKYWDWNPCALHPTEPDTDDDGRPDGAERDAGTNAAGGSAGGACPAGVTYQLETAIEEETGSLQDEPNQDLDSYNATLRRHVRSSTHDASRQVAAEELSRLELAERTAERQAEIAERRRRSILETVRNTEPVRSLPDPTQLTYRPRHLTDTAGTVVGELAEPEGPTSRLARTTGDALPLDPQGAVEEAQEAADRATGSVRTLTSPVTDGDLKRSLLTRNSSPIETATGPAHQAEVRATLDQTLDQANGTVRNPRRLLRSENVVPDVLFSLTRGLAGGRTVWETYQRVRDARAQSPLDSTHYKVLAIGPDGGRNLTPNVPLGTPYHWDVDGQTGTGADTGANGPCRAACSTDRTRGDDVRVTVTAEPTSEGVLEPRLTVRNHAPEEDFPWMLVAFTLPHTRDEGPPDPHGGDRGYVGYLGVDARPRSGDPVSDAPGFQADRTYRVDDMPAWFNVSLSDVGILTTPPGNCDVRDPGDHATAHMEFQPDPATHDDRVDAIPAAGVVEYRHTDEGKELLPAGNNTRLTGLLRGVPEELTLRYAANTTAIACREDASTVADLRDRRDSLRISTTVERGAPGTRVDDGASFAIRRHARYGDRRPAKHTDVVTTTLQDGAYRKTSREEPQQDRRTETHVLEGYPADEIYLAQREWSDLDTQSRPENVTRVWMSGAADRVRAHTDTATQATYLDASAPVGTLRILNGGPNGNCRTYAPSAANHLALDGVTDGPLACYNARFHAVENLTARWTATQAGSNLTLDFRRGPRPDAPDDAEVLVDGPRWIRASVDDLPRTGTITLTRDASDGPEDPGPGSLAFHHRFTPTDVAPDLHLRSKMAPIADDRPPRLLDLRAEDIPHRGTGRLGFEQGTFDVAFPAALADLDLLYTETGRRPSVTGPHAALQTRDDGALVASADLPGFRSLHVDATNTSTLALQGDVATDRPTTLAVETDPGAITGDDHTYPNRLTATLSSLPGPFRLRLHRPDNDTFDLQTDLHRAVDRIDLDGTLFDRAYDLRIRDAADLTLSYTEASDDDFHLEARNSQPLDVQGRIVDAASSDQGDRSYPTAPAGADDHLVHVSGPDSASTLSLDVSDVTTASLRYRQDGDRRHLDASYDFGPDHAGTEAFHLRHEENRADAEDPVTSLDVSDLPQEMTLAIEPGRLDYDASDPIAHLDATVDDPDRGLAIDASVTDLPETVDLTWPSGATKTPEATIHHGGDDPLDEAYLRYRDPGDAYLAANLSSIPRHVTVHATPSAPQMTLSARDGSGPAPVGLLDVRYTASGDPPTVPADCDGPRCPGRDVLSADMEGGGPIASLVARVHGLRTLDAAFQGSNTSGSHLRYSKTRSLPLTLNLTTEQTSARGTLAPLPKTGNLTHRSTLGPNGTLGRLALSWNGSAPIREGALQLTLDRDEPEGRRYVVARTRDLQDLTVRYADDALDATSSGGIGYVDLQHAPADASDRGNVEASSQGEAGGDPVPVLDLLEDPPASDGHYLYTDNDTASSEDPELLHLRAWNFTHARVNATSREAHLRLHEGARSRPAEVRVDRPGVEATVNASALPRSLDLDWDPRPPNSHAGYEVLRYKASSRVPAMEARLNVTAGPQGGRRYLTDLSARDVAPRLHLVRNDTSFHASTLGTGPVGRITGYVQNVTGSRAQADPVHVTDPGPGSQSVLVVDGYRADDGPSFPASLQQVGLSLTDLSHAHGHVRDGRAHVYVDRPSAGSQGASLVLARHRNYTEAHTGTLPAGSASLSVATDAPDPPEDGSPPPRLGGSLQYIGEEALGDGYVYRSTPHPDGTERRRINVTYSDLQPTTKLRYKVARPHPSRSSPAYERLRYEASDAGADVAAHVNDSGTVLQTQIQDLPSQATLNLTRDRAEGALTTDGTGAIGRLEALVRPADLATYPVLQDGAEGLLVHNDTRSSATGRPANLTHLRVTDLEEARWDVRGDVLQGGDAGVSLDHADPDPKDVTLALTTENASTGNTTTTEATLADLPDAWNLTLAADADGIDLDYRADAPVPRAHLLWRRLDPSTTGHPYVEATVHDLGPGRTDLEADLTRDWNLSFEATQPPTRVTAAAVVGRRYLNGTWTDLPEDLDAGVAADLSRGQVTTDDSVGSLDVYQARCEDRNANGVCRDEPNRLTMDSFDDGAPKPYDSVLYHATNRSNQARVPGSHASIPSNASYVHVADLTEARWSLGAPTTPDWHAFHVERPTDLPTRWGILLRGLPGKPATNLTADLRRLPQEATLQLHAANTTYGAPDPADVPAGFPLDGTAPDAEDWYLETDVSTPGARPHIRLTSPRRVLNLSGVRGLGSGSLHLDRVDTGLRDGARLDAHLDSPLEAANLTLQREATPGTTPRYLELGLRDVPTRTTLHWVRNPVLRCPWAPSCTATYGVDTHGETIGRVDLLYKGNASRPGRVDGAADEDTLHVLTDKTHPGAKDPGNGTYVEASLRDVGTVLATLQDRDVHVDADLPDAAAGHPLRFRFTRRDDAPANASTHEGVNATVRGLDGELDLDLRRSAAEDGPWRVAAEVDNSTQEGPFSLFLRGDIEFRHADRNVTAYQLQARNVSPRLRLELREEQDGPKTLSLRTGHTQSIKAHLEMESRVTSTGADGSDVDTDDGGEDTPFHAYVNTDPETGEHTGGSVGLVDLWMGTPDATRPGTRNHMALSRSTGQGQDQVGKSLRLHELERLEGHILPNSSGYEIKLRTGFEPVDHERDLLLRTRDDGSVSSIQSDTWPDASVAMISTEGIPSLRLGGRGGDLEYTCSTRLSSHVCGRAWDADIQFPLKGTDFGTIHHRYSIVIPNGVVHETIVASVQPAVGDLARDSLEGFQGSIAEVEDALLSTTNLVAEAASQSDSTLSTEIEIKPTSLRPCTFQYDLDGVMDWNNQSVAHGSCSGRFTVDHSSDEYALLWKAGYENATGSLESVSTQFKNDAVREGQQWIRSATLDGTVEYVEPSLTYRTGDREYTLAPCFWEASCQ